MNLMNIIVFSFLNSDSDVLNPFINEIEDKKILYIHEEQQDFHHNFLKSNAESLAEKIDLSTL